MAATRSHLLSKVASRLLATEKTSLSSKSEDILYKRLSSLEYVKGSVISTIDAYIREGKIVRKNDLDRCIKELRKHSKFTHALEIMEWMDSRKLNLKFRDYSIRLDLVAKVLGISAAEKYLSDLPSTAKVPNLYGSLLNCYCEEKMTDKAETFLSKMSEGKMIVNAQPYNTVICLYLSLEMPEKVIELREVMKKKNVLPDTFTYNLLMRMYSNLKDVDGVERVLQEMENPKNGELCNWTTYSSLAIAYIKCGYNEKAKLALKKLEEKMDRKNQEAYQFLISLYARVSDIENVIRIWETLKSNLTLVTNQSYLVTLQALKNLNDIQGIKKLYEEWESVETYYDIRIANTVIKAYLKYNMLEEAENIIRNAIYKSSVSFFATWDIFMDFLLENGDVDRALRMMNISSTLARKDDFDAEDWNVEMEQDKLEELLRILNKEHDISSIREVYESVKETALSARGPIYKSLLRTYLLGCATLE